VSLLPTLIYPMACILLMLTSQVQPLPPSPPTPIRIPPGHCWVEGDSRYHTRDSNTYGPIPLALITSRVAYILWPWGRTGLVENGMGKAKERVRRLGGGLV
jgi:inner membrane protease subunit 2